MDSLLGANMDEVDGRSGPPGHVQDPAERHILRHVIVHQRHVPPDGALFVAKLAVHVHHHVVVLGMDQEHGILTLYQLHQIVKVAHTNHSPWPWSGGRTYICGENLNGCEAILNRLAHLAHDVGINLTREHQMMRVVGVRISLPDGSALGDGLVNVDAGILDRKVQQRGGAPKEGGAADLIGRRRTLVFALGHERRSDMSVGLNASGNHNLP